MLDGKKSETNRNSFGVNSTNTAEDRGVELKETPSLGKTYKLFFCFFFVLKIRRTKRKTPAHLTTYVRRAK